MCVLKVTRLPVLSIFNHVGHLWPEQSGMKPKLCLVVAQRQFFIAASIQGRDCLLAWAKLDFHKRPQL